VASSCLAGFSRAATEIEKTTLPSLYLPLQPQIVEKELVSLFVRVFTIRGDLLRNCVASSIVSKDPSEGHLHPYSVVFDRVHALADESESSADGGGERSAVSKSSK